MCRRDAGRYEGNILISGPGFADFTYPLVVTARYPWWSAVLFLLGAAGVFFAIAWVTNSLIFQNPQRDRRIIGSLIGVGFAVVAMAPVYWSSYLENPTWGERIGPQFLSKVWLGSPPQQQVSLRRTECWAGPSNQPHRKTGQGTRRPMRRVPANALAQQLTKPRTSRPREIVGTPL